MNGCELLKCKYYNNGKCTSPHDTCIHQTPDALDGQTALEERDTLIVELQAENKKLQGNLVVWRAACGINEKRIEQLQAENKRLINGINNAIEAIQDSLNNKVIIDTLWMPDMQACTVVDYLSLLTP